MATKKIIIPDIGILEGESEGIIVFCSAIKELLETLLTDRGNDDLKAVLKGDLKKLGLDKRALDTPGNSYNFEAHKT